MNMVSAEFPLKRCLVLRVEVSIKRSEMCVRHQDIDETASKANVEHKLGSAAA